MRYIAIVVFENAFGQKVAQLIEDEDTQTPKYFGGTDEIRESVNPHFLGGVFCLCLDTLETEVL